MNAFKKSMLLGGLVAALTLGASHSAMAQRGDPSQFIQDRIDRAQTQLEITDTDWKAVEPLVAKVVNAQMDVFRLRVGGMGRGGRRNRGGDNGSTNSTSDRPRRGGFGEPSAAMTALQEAIEKKAPTSDLKAKMAAVRAEVKEKEAALDAAEADLRGVLSTRQEAIAVSSGILR